MTELNETEVSDLQLQNHQLQQLLPNEMLTLAIEIAVCITLGCNSKLSDH